MATSALDVSRLTTNRGQQYQLLSLRNQVLESTVHDESDDQQLLNEPGYCAEAQVPNLLASVMLRDEAEQTLSFLSAPGANGEVQRAFQNTRLSRNAGFSSLNQLTRLPVSKLKIDSSFVQATDHDEKGRMITRTIIATGQNLQIEVVGEGVETRGR